MLSHSINQWTQITGIISLCYLSNGLICVYVSFLCDISLSGVLIGNIHSLLHNSKISNLRMHCLKTSQICSHFQGQIHIYLPSIHRAISLYHLIIKLSNNRILFSDYTFVYNTITIIHITCVQQYSISLIPNANKGLHYWKTTPQKCDNTYVEQVAMLT